MRQGASGGSREGCVQVFTLNSAELIGEMALLPSELFTEELLKDFLCMSKCIEGTDQTEEDGYEGARSRVEESMYRFHLLHPASFYFFFVAFVHMPRIKHQFSLRFME